MWLLLLLLYNFNYYLTNKFNLKTNLEEQILSGTWGLPVAEFLFWDNAYYENHTVLSKRWFTVKFTWNLWSATTLRLHQRKHSFKHHWKGQDASCACKLYAAKEPHRFKVIVPQGTRGPLLTMIALLILNDRLKEINSSVWPGTMPDQINEQEEGKENTGPHTYYLYLKEIICL